MPHTTFEYPFETTVSEGIAKRVNGLLEITGDASSYLLVFDDDGSLALFAYPMNIYPIEQVTAVAESGKRFVFYDPLDDGLEYRFLQWRGIDQSHMESLISRSFSSEDFVSDKSGDVISFPEDWDVMF